MLDFLFEPASQAIGAPQDQLKLIFSLLVAFPLGSLYVRIPAGNPGLAHLFSIALSAFFLVGLLDLQGGFFQLCASCLATWLIAKGHRGKEMPWIVFTVVMGHLTINHCIRAFSSMPESTIDITNMQMVLAMKLTTFAWNVQDGRSKLDDLDEVQRDNKLDTVPDLLPFFGYCLFFPSMLVGPASDYKTYDQLVSHTLFPPASPTARRVPQGRKRAAYLNLALGLSFIGIYSTFGDSFGYARILRGDRVWWSWPWWKRLGFVQLAGFVTRTKYYGVWSLSEGACILTGLGFNGYDAITGRTKWNKVRNINIMAIESAQSFKVLFDNWNCRTNVWLRESVYKCVTPKGKKAGSVQSMITFVTSAFWHGIAPGYYLAFITGGFYTSLGRSMRRLIRPFFQPKNAEDSVLLSKVYNVIGMIVVQTHVNYVASAFILLTFKDCLTAWNRMGWYGHISILLSLAFFRFAGPSIKAQLPASATSKTNNKTNVAKPKSSPPPEPADANGDMGWVKDALDESSRGIDAGAGVDVDGGLVQRTVLESGGSTGRTSRADSPS